MDFKDFETYSITDIFKAIDCIMDKEEFLSCLDEDTQYDIFMELKRLNKK